MVFARRIRPAHATVPIGDEAEGTSMRTEFVTETDEFAVRGTAVLLHTTARRPAPSAGCRRYRQVGS